MVLVSPGVQVSVTDESFFAAAGPGTVPLIFIATKQDKLTPDGTATAPGTTSATADSLYLISSQRELLQTFGDPDFNEIGGTAQNGYPLNEYGLLAAYSYLGAANRAYVIRADIDLTELDPTSVEPTSAPADDTYWNNLNNFVPGLFKWSGTAWAAQAVTIVKTTALITNLNPEPSSGYANNIFIVNFDDLGNFQYMQRITGQWQVLGDNAWTSGDFQWAPHTFVPTVKSDNTALDLNSYWLKTTTANSGLSLDVSHYDSALGQFVSNNVVISDTHTAYYALSSVSSAAVPAGTVVGFVDPHNAYSGTPNTAAPTPQNNGVVAGKESSLATVNLEVHNGANTTVVTGSAPVTAIPLTNDTTTIFSVNGTPTGDLYNAGDTTIDDLIIRLNNDAAFAGIDVSKSLTNQLIFTDILGRDIVLSDFSLSIAAELFIDVGTQPIGAAAGTYVTSNFETFAVADLTIEQDTTQPTGAVTAGTYWYDPSFIVDVLVNTGTGVWDDFAGTISVQSDAPASPSDGDLWVETDQVANYPVMYRRTAGAWVLVDNTDQTTTLGVVFADARPADSTTGVPPVAGSGTGINNRPGGATTDPDLDADRPDPLLYPGGTLLFNTRYSGRNVKVWTENATTSDHLTGLVSVDRWVSASGNAVDGSMIAGTDAQKKVVTDAIAAVVIGNEEVRDDTIFYNLIAAPGFPELMDEMITLNVDRKEQAFVLGDSPFHLASNTTSLQAWASNSNNAAGNGDDGLVTANANLGVYYPSGLSTNTDGSEVVVPASHMILRTMAYNDQVSYPWYAPAGFARGVVSNASAVGYLNSSDEFVVASLNEGQRDTLYLNNVNPIASIPNRGIIVYGQKTRQPVASALDRVNVARLINYIRFQADQLAQPFMFEPNDRVTRDAVKEAFNSFLAELVTLRGLQDFLVVVDESNNSPARIDRNELWIDIAVQPIKSIEFIYIPIRIQNTGDDLNL